MSPLVAPSKVRPHEGLRIARLFRQARDLREIRCCDLDIILADDHIDVTELPIDDPGFTACLICQPNADPGILLAAGQDIGRRRFSIAHELGHFHIPSHRKAGVGLRCSEADLHALGESQRIEWEANEFAAELLMPAKLFGEDTNRRPINFETTMALAAPDMYNVSITAATWRVIQTTREACCLVRVTNGKVDWVAKSSSCPYIAVNYGEPPSTESVAGSVLRGEAGSIKEESVSGFSWLDGGRAERCEVFESTHTVPRLGQVLSLVRIVDPYQ